MCACVCVCVSGFENEVRHALAGTMKPGRRGRLEEAGKGGGGADVNAAHGICAYICWILFKGLLALTMLAL